MPDIADGATAEYQGSGAKPYILKNVGGVYSCTCPAWRNQSVPIDRRTCKHLRAYRGSAAEDARLNAGPVPPTTPVAVAETVQLADVGKGPPVLLAESWDNATDLAGWWISEKLDGVRAYWTGSQFLSRQGNVYHAPAWFVAGLPKTPLDGELWIGRKAFQRTVSIVRRADQSDHWKEVRFALFDAPQQVGGFEDRWNYLTDWIKSAAPAHAQLTAQERCQGIAHLRSELVS
jgi:DNA ligase-1